MVEAKIGHGLRSRVIPRPRVVGRIRVSGLLEVSDAEFARLVEGLEKDPLFQVLSQARSGGARVLSYSPAARTSLSPKFYEKGRPETWASEESFDVEGFLRRREAMLALIRRIGRDGFEEHFLYARSGKTLPEAARECRLSQKEAEDLNRFLLEFSTRAEFFNPSGLSSAPGRRLTLVGQIVAGKELSIALFSPHLARGRYQVNEAALKGWLKDSSGRSEKSRARKLMDQIRLVNIRQSAFFRVLSRAVDLQKNYLDSRDENRMAPVSADGLARELRLSPSTVSRLIHGKSVLLPWGTEAPISSLLPGRHKALLAALKKVMGQAARPLTDAQLAEAVYREFDLKASRRSINACRHQLLGANS